MLHFQSPSASSSLGLLVGLSVTLTCVSLCLAAAVPQVGLKESEPNANKDLANSLCKENLAKLRASDGLSREKVTDLFEQALENIAKSNDYIEQIRATAKPETIEEYNRNGGLFVLKISDKRREFLARLSDMANGGNGDADEKTKLFGSYYTLACGFEHTTATSLEAMQKSAKIKAAAAGRTG